MYLPDIEAKTQQELQETPLVWTSTLQRTHQTIRHFGYEPGRIIALAKLNEIYAGKCEGMTYEEIQEKMPEVGTQKLTETHSGGI